MEYLRYLLMSVPLALFIGTSFAQSQNSEESDLAAIYGDVDTVSIATGETQPIARAPAPSQEINPERVEKG